MPRGKYMRVSRRPARVIEDFSPNGHMAWDYLVAEGTITVNELKNLGIEGWELTTVAVSDYGFRLFFKRPLTTKTKEV